MDAVQLSLRDYIGIFLRRWWVIAATALALVAIAIVMSARQTPLYRSSASVLINQASVSELFDPFDSSSNSTSVAYRTVQNEARFLGSGLVSSEAISRLGYEAYVGVSTESEADILTVTAEWDDPVQARDIAQTYADTYVDVRQRRFASDRRESARLLAERLVDLDLQILDAEDAELVRLQLLRQQIAGSLDLLNISAELADVASAEVIDQAFLPGVPFTPQTNRNIALAAIVGLMVGTGIVLLIEALDRSVKSRAQLELLTPGAPNLAVLPALGKPANSVGFLVSDGSAGRPFAEEFRTLRAALQYAAVDRPIHVLQVVSAHSGAGKTTVSANLAITLAAAGRTVAVVDCDLRRPTLHRLFGVPQVPGFTTAVIGAMPISECVHTIAPVAGTAPLIIPSGPLPPGPAELLGSTAAEKVIETIREQVDMVIIDTPPILAVADAMVLSRYVDASVLVVDAKRTSRSDVVQSFERLTQSGTPIVGTILNRAKIGGIQGYGYATGGSARDSGLVGRFSRRSARNIETLGADDIPAIEFASSRVEHGDDVNLRPTAENSVAEQPLVVIPPEAVQQPVAVAPAVMQPAQAAEVQSAVMQPAQVAEVLPENPRIPPPSPAEAHWADEIVLRD